MSFYERLANVIQFAINNDNGAKGVAESIKKMEQRTNPPIKRELIAKLAKDLKGDESLPTKHWIMLDNYLRKKCGVSLAALFGHNGILDDLAEAPEVVFMIGSVPDPDVNVRRINFSRWDIRAMSEIASRLSGSGHDVHVRIEDVIYRSNADSDSEFGNGARTIADNEAWYHVLADDQSRTNCILIGSPRVSHCTEVVLADMFGVPRFTPYAAIPFWFVWPSQYLPVSTFQCPVSEIEHRLGTSSENSQIVASLSEKGSNTAAMYFNGKLHPVYRNKNEWTTYAAVVVQRRKTGRIFAAICGLTGPATYGAAKALPQLFADLSPTNGDGSSQVFWGIVGVGVHTLSTRDSYRRDERRVDRHEVIVKLTPWESVSAKPL